MWIFVIIIKLKVRNNLNYLLSIISSQNNIPLCHVLTNPKPNDNQHIKILISKLRNNKNIKLSKNTKIIGDKGYLSTQKKYNVNKVKVTLIVPKKINQKSRYNRINNKSLNKRFTVEQTFSHIKRTYRRLQLIYDRDIKNYETFLLMAFTCQIIRKI